LKALLFFRIHRFPTPSFSRVKLWVLLKLKFHEHTLTLSEQTANTLGSRSSWLSLPLPDEPRHPCYPRTPPHRPWLPLRPDNSPQASGSLQQRGISQLQTGRPGPSLRALPPGSPQFPPGLHPTLPAGPQASRATFVLHLGYSWSPGSTLKEMGTRSALRLAQKASHTARCTALYTTSKPVRVTNAMGRQHSSTGKSHCVGVILPGGRGRRREGGSRRRGPGRPLFPGAWPGADTADGRGSREAPRAGRGKTAASFPSSGSGRRASEGQLKRPIGAPAPPPGQSKCARAAKEPIS